MKVYSREGIEYWVLKLEEYFVYRVKEIKKGKNVW